MAVSGKAIDEQTRRQIQKLRDAGVSVRETAKAMLVSPKTVQRLTQKKSELGLAEVHASH